MPYDDLRAFLARLDAEGQLLRIAEMVLPEPDLGAAGRAVANLGDAAPALLFTDIFGYAHARVALNVHGSWANHALMLDLPKDMPPKEQFHELRERWKRFPVPVERRERDAPPWRENAIVENIDLFHILPLFRLNATDGGPYLDKASVVSADPTAEPDFGRQNVGIYRLQVKGPDKLAVQAAPVHDLGRHMRLAAERGQPTLPVAICVGNDPVVSFVAGMPLEYGQSEYEMAGALRGKPCPVATSPVHGLTVPWGAEAVLEGHINVAEREFEGPFGEFTGHSTGGRLVPTVTITAVHHRHRPIFEHLYLGVPWTEIDYMLALNTCLPIYEQLTSEFPEVQAVNAMYTHGLVTIIAVRPRAGGFARAVALRALTTPHGLGYCKLVIVVDDTVDPFNLQQVMWALSTKVNATHDLITIPRMNVVPLDPSDDPPGLNTRVIIDATTPRPPDMRGSIEQEVRARPESARWEGILQSMLAGGMATGPISSPPTGTPLGPCPRCRSTGTEAVGDSPVPNAWQLFRCTTCWYVWRSIEPPDALDPDMYPVEFRLTPEQVSRARLLT